MRLSEIYTSVQGEGPHTGAPIQFIRFGGCNLRCPGWPCDTQFAIDPQFKDQWEQITAQAIVDRLDQWPKHVCITGGEPLTQRSMEMADLAQSLFNSGYKIDLFTNGTQALPPWTFDRDVCVVMDWKCPGSGEEAVNTDVRLANARQLGQKDAIKFVVKDHSDLDYAQEITRSLCLESRAKGFPSLWVGAAWGAISDQEIIDFIFTHTLPWNLNVQVHKHIWAPDLRGV